jgi:hypothetical protein
VNNSKANELSVRSLLETLRQSVDDLSLTKDVVTHLLPEGRPHDFETQLWDYKEKLPVLPPTPSELDKKTFKAELGDIIKDAVAFHNAYGGYIIFGVSDKGKDRLKGCDKELDCGDLNKRIAGYTEANFECLYQIMEVVGDASKRHVGVLLIPRRSPDAQPVKFKRDGPEKPTGGKSFSKDTYVRVRDECRPAAASSEDWKFLHSDRTPPGGTASPRHRSIKSNLKARDPDLIEFVGREDSLAELRTWLTDVKTPVRLITGIGGLGKTTLAYRFAEEVTDTKASSIEWVVWLTAKEQTYSALRGEMVPTGKVDFDDLRTLYHAMLKALSHEFPIADEEPDIDELTDRVVEALSTYSCLVIVDDIDGLAPDQQKEVVSALNGIALRTVGRDIPPSRILMTSRIDQGLPPTAVTKIVGLGKEPFLRHVANLCTIFGIGNIEEPTLTELFEATSGSPLFASSIVRLVKSGENLQSVVETWKGQEGEDVRRFAFEREVKRLNTSQAKLLYAVLLLGETSVNDLASVLEITAKVVRTRIAELQAYHLLATTVKGTGDATIFAPSDLVSISEIVRNHLGAQAETVEQACAKAEEQRRATTRSVGLGIRGVVGLWEQKRFPEAVIFAKDLREKNPTDGDVASIFGAALLRVTPPRYNEADEALESARQLGCARPELLSDIITTKKALEDWPRLYVITKSVYSREYSKDIGLDAFLLACKRMIGIARDRNDDKRIADLGIEAVERISVKMERQRVEPSYFQSLSSSRFDFAREYIHSLQKLYPRNGDKLNVFDGVFRLSEAGVVLTDLVRIGLDGLRSWWKDVEQRPFIDHTAIDILGRQIRRMERLESKTREIQPGGNLAAQISALSHDLAYRGAQLVK